MYSITIQKELIIKRSINEEIKAINNKIEQNKAQHNLDRQTVKISALSSENVSQYEFVTTKDVFPEKNLEKAAPIKKFEKSCQVKSSPHYRFYFLQIPQH